MTKGKGGRPKGYRPPSKLFRQPDADSSLSNEIAVMKAWCARREHKGAPWTSDELWSRLNKLWPTLTQEQKEHIFQSCTGKPHQ